MSFLGHNNRPPLIFALDIASNMGICEGVAGERPRLYSERLVKEHDNEDDCFARAIKWVKRRTDLDLPDYVFIEAPIPAVAMQGRTNANAVAMLWGLAACIAGTFRARNIPVRRCNIQAVRKRFIGHGNLKGDEAKRQTVALCRALGWDPPNHDSADAAAVWNYGVLQVAPSKAPLVEPILLSLNEGVTHGDGNR
jgi:hypothetical protein